MNWTIMTAVTISSTSILLTLITATFSILAYCKVVGMEKSTHRIEWQPMPKPESDPVFEPENTGDGMSASELAKGLSEISDEINDEFI